MSEFSEQRLQQGIEQADLRVLLMVLFHMTGDQKWLKAPYSPRRDITIIAPTDAGLPEKVQREIREAAQVLLADPSREPVIGDPGDERMTEMMSACLGEKVPRQVEDQQR